MVCQTWNKYFTPFQVNKTRFYCQQLCNAVIYSCYCIVLVDLLCIFLIYNVFMDIFIMLHIESMMQFLASQWRFFVACSAEFVTVRALMLQFNFFAILLALFHAQHCSVAFNKPNEDALAYQLILLSFKR